MDNGYLKFKDYATPLMRRVAGDHDLRLDGISDLLSRARGATHFDFGCDNGDVCHEFARNGARRVMGCDIDHDSVVTARRQHANYRCVAHRFEVVDLAGGYAAMKQAFGKDADLKHDIVTMLATYHKIKRKMDAAALAELMGWIGGRTVKYFAWRGYEEEIPIIDKQIAGLTRIHTSLISDLGPCAIWARI